MARKKGRGGRDGRTQKGSREEKQQKQPGEILKIFVRRYQILEDSDIALKHKCLNSEINSKSQELPCPSKRGGEGRVGYLEEEHL